MTKDLVILVPDADIKTVVCTLLEHRRPSLGIRKVDFHPILHLESDGGVRKKAHDSLRSYVGHCHNAIVLFDYRGCGEEGEKDAEEIEAGVMSNLTRSGWNHDNALVVVIVPELEAWVWSNSPWVAKAVGWQGGDTRHLKSYVKRMGFQFDPLGKPVEPKEALEHVLRKCRISRSASIYGEIARKVSLRDCGDRSFSRLKNFLGQKFPARLS